MADFQARPRRWATRNAAVAVIVLTLSGCGGSSSSSSSSSAPASSSSTGQTTQPTQNAAQFKASITPVLNQFKQASQATGIALQKAGSKSDAVLVTRFQQLAVAWAAAVAKLKTLHPPAQFAAAYNRLSSQVNKVPSDLAAIASAAQSHSAQAAKAATTKLINDILNAKATSTTISNGTS